MRVLVSFPPKPYDGPHHMRILDPEDFISIVHDDPEQTGRAALPPEFARPSTARDAAAEVKLPALVSVKTAAAQLECSERTVRRRIADGVLPAFEMGAQLRIRTDDLRAYSESLPVRRGARTMTPLARQAPGWSGL